MIGLYKTAEYAAINRDDDRLFKKVIEYLPLESKDRVLEIGCGKGFLTKKLQEINRDAVGIDINPEAISNGVAKNLKVMDATNLEFSPNTFDKIYSCHTIEHIPNIEELFQETERVLRPGGKALFVYPWELFRGYGAIWTSIALFKTPFRCREIHLHKLAPSKIKKIIRDSNLEHIESHFSLLTTPQYFTILQKK